MNASQLRLGGSSTGAAFVVALWILLCACSGATQVARLQDGDLIFQTSESAQSLAIQRATHSPFSHMGMIVLRHGRPVVFEASDHVQYTPLDTWIASGSGAMYVVKRLRDAETRWTPSALARMQSVLRDLEGLPYDGLFEWSDGRMYCSELIWKVYDRVLQVQIGELQRLREFHLDDPEVQRQVRQRYGKNVPLDEPVISPAAMYTSPLLDVVEDAFVDRARRFRGLLQTGDVRAAQALMAAQPRRWWESREGPGQPWEIGTRGPWELWDAALRSRKEELGWKSVGRDVTVTVRETNDYFQLLERGWVTTQVTYFFDADGKVQGMLVRADGERPPGRTDEFLAWARQHEPKELAFLMPDGEIDPSGDRPERYRALLTRWRQAAGLPATPTDQASAHEGQEAEP